MKLTVIHATTNCDASSCPTIYKDEGNNYVIQGFKMKATDKANITLPEGEDAIVVPADFLNAFIQKQQA